MKKILIIGMLGVFSLYSNNDSENCSNSIDERARSLVVKVRNEQQELICFNIFERESFLQFVTVFPEFKNYTPEKIMNHCHGSVLQYVEGSLVL